ACLDQSLKTCLDERFGTTAEHRLLAEKVRLRLILESRLDNPGPRTADSLGIAQCQRQRASGGILHHGNETGRPIALLEHTTNEVAWRLRSDHKYVDPLRRLDLAVMDVE